MAAAKSTEAEGWVILELCLPVDKSGQETIMLHTWV